MIERQFVMRKLREFQIQEHIGKIFSKTGYSHIEIKRTPLGENVIVYTTRPGIVVGKKGENIKKLTALLKNKYRLDNPQLEIGEIANPMLDVNYVADRIAASLERFSQKRFKSIGYRVLQDIMDAGAIGAEIVLSGLIPSSRAKSWRFSAGYLKKSGDINQSLIHKKNIGFTNKRGTIGIRVSIMTPDIKLIDKTLTVKDEFLRPAIEEVAHEEIKPEKTVKVSQAEGIPVIEEVKVTDKTEEVKVTDKTEEIKSTNKTEKVAKKTVKKSAEKKEK
ncbi:MAG: 30S ribosomal protein S3 [Nanoarchaeota archaeon]|nr:30S ribosomal protein S3 [Nanoarchaeota archaeon]